jgi:hypothetical protein
MTTANPYVCSDVASSKDISVPYCDSEDDTEYHNGLGSDALIDDIHLDGPFDEEMRKLHKRELTENKHETPHYMTWKKHNKTRVENLRDVHHKKHSETQKANHTDAGKKGPKKNKNNKGHEKMSKFESEFVTLYNTWTTMVYNLHHQAWVESRAIVDMSESEARDKRSSEYRTKYEKSQILLNYLQQIGSNYSKIDEDETFDNFIASIKNLRTEREKSIIEKDAISLVKTNKNIERLTGGK